MGVRANGAPGDRDVAVVGGGPAGLTCATALAAAGLRVTLVDREGLGGRLANADQVFGVDDFAVGWSGAEAAGSLAERAVDAGVQIEFAEVSSLGRAESGTWNVDLGSGSARADTVVYAAGSSARHLSIPGAEKFEGKGISYCAACDGPLFRGKAVVVVLRDKWGADEAVQLSRAAASVHALVDPDPDPELARFLPRLAGLSNVVVETSAEPTAVIGDVVVSGLTVSVNGRSKTVPAEGIFGSLSTVPNTELLTSIVSIDEARAVLVDSEFLTSAPGMYAIGETRSQSKGTAAQAIEDGRAVARLILERSMAADASTTRRAHPFRGELRQ
jgi:thioredoxin reductase (NADPH)